jgi:hypothetical protein
MTIQDEILNAATDRAALAIVARELDLLAYRVHREGRCCNGALSRAQPAQGVKQLAEDRHLESTDVRQIFEYWIKTLQKNGNVKLTAERRRCIQARLKEGYSVAECLKAIDGLARSDFHTARGNYRGQRRYDDLTLIFRNGSRLEGFRDNADGGNADVARFL